MGLCSPDARAVAVQSACTVGSGFGFGGGAAMQSNSSVKRNYLVSNWVIAFAWLDFLIRFGPLKPYRRPPICIAVSPSLSPSPHYYYYYYITPAEA